MKRLGDILISDFAIGEASIARALAVQKTHADKLGHILVSLGEIGLRTLHQALAIQQELPFIDLLQETPDLSLLESAIPPEHYIERKLVPWRRTTDGDIIIALAQDSDENRRWCKSQFGVGVQFVYTSPFDIKRVVEQRFSGHFETQSRLTLWQKFPMLSARETIIQKQRVVFFALAMAVFISSIVAPYATLIGILAICNLVFLMTLFFKTWVFCRGIHHALKITSAYSPEFTEDHSLPIYTILVPMYREPESLPGMLQSLASLDYPQSKLDIKLVLEADDDETYQVACKLRPAYHYDIIRVPFAEPRTKPRACNYALRFAKGEYVTVFDADDRPEPLQLRKAVSAFRQAGDHVACLQARLGYYNAHDNWITRFFSIEYSILFRFMLPGLAALGLPIPLGGTSNHMSMKKLRELGEWDPFNVTEDADLGMRISAHGGKTLLLDSYTLEESPIETWAWIKQRGRWIKGYMQTWLVHMRAPLKLYKQIGLKAFIGFQFFIGLSCLTFLIAPLVWLISLMHYVLTDAGILSGLPLWLVWLAWINLALNFITHWYASFIAAMQQPLPRSPMLLSALLYPFYLWLHTVASYRALWQLIVKPHFWDKTRHGMTRAVALENHS